MENVISCYRTCFFYYFKTQKNLAYNTEYSSGHFNSILLFYMRYFSSNYHDILWYSWYDIHFLYFVPLFLCVVVFLFLMCLFFSSSKAKKSFLVDCLMWYCYDYELISSSTTTTTVTKISFVFHHWYLGLEKNHIITHICIFKL